MKRFITLALCLFVSVATYAQTQVIAHRGYHATKNSYDNTISSLINAQKLKVDGVLIAIHGMRHRDIKNVQKATFDEIRSLPLENGETVPTLEEYLIQAKKSKKTKLIIEIKSHPTKEQEARVVKNILAAVKQHKLVKNVEYIAFSKYICDQLVKNAPRGTKIAYLNGDLTPEQCKKERYTGIDYNLNTLKAHPEWINKCHELGLTVNVWTVNDKKDMQWFIDMGVDYITTDKPDVLKRMLKNK